MKLFSKPARLAVFAYLVCSVALYAAFALLSDPAAELGPGIAFFYTAMPWSLVALFVTAAPEGGFGFTFALLLGHVANAALLAMLATAVSRRNDH